MFSENDASDILAKHAEVVAAANVVAKTTNVNKILEDSRNSISNIIKIPTDESIPFVYEELTLDFEGPPPPTVDEVLFFKSDLKLSVFCSNFSFCLFLGHGKKVLCPCSPW